MALGTNTLDIYARDGNPPRLRHGHRCHPDRHDGLRRWKRCTAPTSTTRAAAGSICASTTTMDYDVTTLTLAGPTLSKTLSMADSPPATATTSTATSGPWLPRRTTSISPSATAAPAAPGCTTCWTATARSSWPGWAAAAMYSRYNAVRPCCGLFVERKGFDYAGWTWWGTGSTARASSTSTSDRDNNYFY